MKQIDRITAINRILEVSSGERISTIGELSTIPQAVTAGTLLDLAVVTIQTDYLWNFNNIDEGATTADTDGQVTLPDNLGFFRACRTTASVEARHLKPVRGLVYDSFNHTFNLGSGTIVYWEGKLVWDFEDLPVAFQRLAIAQTRKDIVGGSNHLSPTRFQVETVTYKEAFQAAEKFDVFLSGGQFRGPDASRRYPPRNKGIV